jgi:hypothetical protein
MDEATLKKVLEDGDPAAALRLARDIEFLTGTIEGLESLAEDAPTLPIMSDVDMAIMCLRRALKEMS